jgi:putative endonuclease
MYYFYVLLSEKDLKHYYGSSSDLKRRFQEHSKGEVASTKYRRPLRLVYYEAYEHLQQARKREQQVKTSGSVRVQLLARLSFTENGPARPPEGKPGQ